MASLDHGDPGDAPSMPEPSAPVTEPRRPSAAEEARTVAASTNTATLASLSSDGHPWASFVTYGLVGGDPVLCVSHMAEHGRNLAADQRVSLSVVAPGENEDPLASGRITLAGVVFRPTGEDAAVARDAHLAAVPAAKYYIDYSDFTVWQMTVDRVRWVGGYGRMDSATAQDYAQASPDPVRPGSAYAVDHLNADHADALREMTAAFGGYPDAVSATCTGADRYGLDIAVTTPNGVAYTRVGYLSPISSIDELRSATVELTKNARRS